MSGGVAEKLREGECGFVLHAGDDVLVGGHRESGGGVPEAFGDDLDRHAGLEEQGGVGVAEVVEPERWQTGVGDELLERVRQQLGMGRCTVGPAERLLGSSGSNSGSSSLRSCRHSRSRAVVVGSRLMVRLEVRDLPRVSWSS